jgi:Lrp/AsnC family transcriptional regulator, leucine-responsive regulatory protein
MKKGKEKEQTTSAPLLDSKDFEILRLLQDDAKLTVREIASSIHLSPTPTFERIRRMENAGIIKKYAALLDPRKVNKKLMVICLVSLKEHDKKTAQSFVESVTNFKEVVECYNISGESDFLLKIISESMETYHDFFINYLGTVKGIGLVKSIFVMDVIKDTHEVL